MKHYLSVLLLFSSALAFGQEKLSLTKPNYQLASKFSPSKLSKLIFSTEVNPNWINFGEKFWYEYNTPNGKKWYLVDPKTRRKSELFDHVEMARRISSIVKNPFVAQNLEIRNLRFLENDENKIRFEVPSTKDTIK